MNPVDPPFSLTVEAVSSTGNAGVSSSSSAPCRRLRGVAFVFWLGTALGFSTVTGQSTRSTAGSPNFVVIFCDDLGYADIGCYGSRDIRTPNIDRMAAQGIRFTDFYVAQAVCSASRAALLTGCYPNRMGILGALGPSSKTGIHANEVTLAELLKTRGYATAIYGKWHLGDDWQFLPTRHGFDDYLGLPYSNDMWPNHPTAATDYPPLPLIEGDRTVRNMPDQTQLTTWYTERAVRFIEQHKDQPFFLYVPHTMPHVPLHVSDKFKGKSKTGLYGDVIMEIDWSVGQILEALRKQGLDECTLVIFTSDNGPWLSYGNHAGSAGEFREGKATTFEGGLREPFIARWPGKIPEGKVCHELAATIDVLPTLARLARAELPVDRVIDGRDIWPLMSAQPGARTPHEVYYYYWDRELQAVRSGQWKLHLPHSYTKPDPPGTNGAPGQMVTRQIELSLFDLKNDIGEANNVAAEYPEVLQRLTALAEKAREDLGDSRMQREGKNVRPVGQINEGAAVIEQGSDGFVFLHARNATVHGTNLRYEPQAHKNTIGVWTLREDWVSWDFQIGRSGTFAVEILQGCGSGSGGSEVVFSTGDQTLLITVQETGGFQNFVTREIGKFSLAKAGRYTLSVRAQSKPGPAVMDLRQILLRPVGR